MKNHNWLSLFTLLVFTTSASAFVVKNSWPGTKVGEPIPKVNIPRVLAKNLANFDDLDFRVYTNQKWNELQKSHAENIIVHYPDGSITQGLQAHIDKLKVSTSPDIQITEHPVRFGTNDGVWTAVIGFVSRKPKDGKPTGGQSSMVTLGHWNNKGVMDEEYLFSQQAKK
ncbi:hypothetical protein EAE91_14190 [Photorhabdus noenieputensis]|uniref:hypothetical protein n=1 Tax=Photorhabdus noenieputensis TaxID=1208607 RepID=UPI001BD29187|nr:hypothetical protein [Photorhabdus noenieputensis]MBS9438256.1 hypothetical protein [Photorhabdus noenieputensis]MCK3669882.1 hypothetical protein [Photorhabdus noenieputensis]